MRHNPSSPTDPQVRPEFKELWDSWDLDTIKDFYAAIHVWHQGTGYMMKEDDKLDPETPLDAFQERHPKEMEAYSALVNSVVPDKALYRILMFDQAEMMLEDIEATEGEPSDVLTEVYFALKKQNTLFAPKLNKNDFADFEHDVDLRRYSSWTSVPYVAYRLGHDPVGYQIGDVGVIVRLEQPNKQGRVIHSWALAHEFERYCFYMRDEAKEYCKPFMTSEAWTWQKEYVVESKLNSVKCDGVMVVANDGDSHYERIKRLAGMEDED